MARRSTVKSGTFFLREVVTTNGTTFATDSIDVSSFIDVLNGELIRIKQVWFQWGTDAGGPVLGTDVRASGAVQGSSAVASVSTESRTTVGSMSSSNIVCANTLYAHVDSTANIDFITNETSANPAEFDDGYLVATDAIHLNANQSADTWAANIAVVVMLECEIVKLSLSDAQAVLVSQTIG